MNMTERAIYELQRAGLFDKDSDYDGMIGEAVKELLEVFAKQGHSGYSASIVSTIFKKLVDGETLTPLSSDPSEWAKVDKTTWQNKRKFACFSYDGGKTWYNHNDCVWIFREENGSRWQTQYKNNGRPEFEEGETVVRVPQCHQCMLRDTCPDRYIPDKEVIE